MNLFKKLKLRLEKDRKILQKILVTALSRSIAALGNLFFNFVLAKQLGVSEFGSFMLVYSILIGLGMLANFGMPSAILRFASILYSENNRKALENLRSKVFIFSLSTTTFLALILILSRKLIVDSYIHNTDYSKVIILFGLTLPFYSNIIIQSTFMKAFKMPQVAPFFEMGLSVFYTAVLVSIASWFGVNTDSYFVAICFLISTSITLFLGRIVINRKIRKIQTEDVVQSEINENIFKTLPDYAGSNITTYLLKFSPTIILGFFATTTDVGIYSLANSAAFVINFILWIVSAVYSPYFASYYKENRLKELRDLIRNSILYMMLIAVPVFLVIMIFPKEILSLFGKEFSEGITALRILAVAQLFNVLTGPVYFVLNMTGHQKNLRNIVIITAIISIASSLILTPLYGFMGATIATAIGLIIQNSMGFAKTNEILKQSLFSKSDLTRIKKLLRR